MHEAPERAWTLEDLARVAGLSRAAFARNFSASVGEVPVYFDDMVLSVDHIVPTRGATWGELKRLYR